MTGCQRSYVPSSCLRHKEKKERARHVALPNLHICICIVFGCLFVLTVLVPRLCTDAQKEGGFRAYVAQAGGVPLLLKLTADRSVLVVTAATGAVNALVHRMPAYGQWVRLVACPTARPGQARSPLRTESLYLYVSYW